ncbi:MAG: EAL domain-containing protein [Myxococcales bacterium]|nr:EAL domain-containing protein [Myxococcales bacterium]MCB9754658.1 EAL domain-containing protein [Myxococcales bacterium]
MDRSGRDGEREPARRRTILVVDDDAGHVALIARALEDAPYTLERAASLREARELIERVSPELLLVDLRLPDGVGTELIPRGEPRRPVVVMTSHGSEQAAVDAMRAGALDYLVKSPATFLDMAHIVERALREWNNLVERRRVERALRASEDRFNLAVQGTSDGVWDWHLGTREVYYAPRFLELLGVEEGALAPSIDSLLGRVHPEDRVAVEAAIDAHLDRGEDYDVELRIDTRFDGYRWFRSRAQAIWDDEGRPERMVGSITDIHESKQAEARLNRLAQRDELTGLPNRALFMALLEGEIARAQSSGARFAVLFLDLDRFKLVNESLGHAVGDRMLVSIARRVQGGLGARHTIARFGGDELMILMRDVSGIEEPEAAARRIHGLLSQPFKLGGHSLFVTTSIGIVLSSSARTRPEEYLRDADIAMYHAKNIGKARHAVFDASMHTRVRATLQLHNDLRHALDGGQFEVHYQPIVSLADGRLHGFEALVRWRHPTRGLLSPGVFMPLAEETGLVIPLDRWVLQRACRQLAAWQALERADARSLRVSVNLSGHQLSDDTLVDAVRAALADGGIEPSTLALEITEGILVSGSDEARRTIDGLYELGVELHLDDFGVGYSSLSYLHRFPIHALKIDRSFIGHLALGDRESAIVQTIIVLGRHLNMRVTAEGVETPQQLARLQALGCTSAQGYLFARPLPAAKVDALLTADALPWDVGVQPEERDG